uniref:Uncharacterized protein n=1 Tax=Rhizophora mucronata TaxID=61149 RepID=A0A2P2P5F2_RHIMU
MRNFIIQTKIFLNPKLQSLLFDLLSKEIRKYISQKDHTS